MSVAFLPEDDETDARGAVLALVGSEPVEASQEYLDGMTVEDHRSVALRVFEFDTPVSPAEILERHRLRELEAAKSEPGEVERQANNIRARLSPAPVEGFLKTPDEMIDDLEWAKHHTGQIALVLKNAGRAARSARRSFDLAWSLALKDSTGRSAEMREADAMLATQVERMALDDAEIVLEYAKSTARGVETSGSLTQSQASILKTQLSLAGTGREA